MNEKAALGTPSSAGGERLPLSTGISEIMNRINGTDVVRSLHPTDSMGGGSHYFAVGRNALFNVVSALTARLACSGGELPIANILDFGCGYGRVARFLRAAFPDAQLDVTDFDQTGVAWCVENLNAKNVLGEIAEGAYDLIWLGSVFTHLSEAASIKLLEELKRGLRSGGVLIYRDSGEIRKSSLRISSAAILVIA